LSCVLLEFVDGALRDFRQHSDGNLRLFEHFMVPRPRLLLAFLFELRQTLHFFHDGVEAGRKALQVSQHWLELLFYAPETRIDTFGGFDVLVVLGVHALRHPHECC